MQALRVARPPALKIVQEIRHDGHDETPKDETDSPDSGVRRRLHRFVRTVRSRRGLHRHLRQAGARHGQYCPDGKSSPPKAGAPVARAPQSIDPELSVPPEARDGAQVSGGKGKSQPKGMDIQCGKWKSQNGGCRGIFTILK